MIDTWNRFTTMNVCITRGPDKLPYMFGPSNPLAWKVGVLSMFNVIIMYRDRSRPAFDLGRVSLGQCGRQHCE